MKYKVLSIAVVVASSSLLYFNQLPGEQFFALSMFDANSETLTEDLFLYISDQYDDVLDSKFHSARPKQKLGANCYAKITNLSVTREKLTGKEKTMPEGLTDYDLENIDNQDRDDIHKALGGFLLESENIKKLKFNEYLAILEYLQNSEEAKYNKSKTDQLVSATPKLVQTIETEIVNSKSAFDTAFLFLKEENEAAVVVEGLCKVGKRLEVINKKVEALRKITENTIIECFGPQSENSQCLAGN